MGSEMLKLKQKQYPKRWIIVTVEITDPTLQTAVARDIIKIHLTRWGYNSRMQFKKANTITTKPVGVPHFKRRR